MAETGNIILGFDNQSDDATLSGGSWSLPLTNLQNRDLSVVARSTDATLANTQFKVAFDYPRSFKFITVGPTNIQTAAAFRFRTYNDVAFTELDEDTGWVRPFTREPFGSLPWGHPNLWDGILPWDDADRLIWPIQIYANPVSSQYWSMEIDDTSNPDGYVEMGRLFMPRYWQPTRNFTPDNNFVFEDNSRHRPTLNGGDNPLGQRDKRVFRFGFDNLENSELFTSAYDFDRTAGYDGEVFVIPDPNDDFVTMQRRSFMGRNRRLNGLALAAAGVGSTGYELIEDIN